MAESIDESVSVSLVTNCSAKTVIPSFISWNGRRYAITRVGLHYMERVGRVLFHIFSVTDGVTYFKLRFDTENLGWKLLEIENNIQ